MKAWGVTEVWEVLKVKDVNQTAWNVVLTKTEQMNTLSNGSFLFNF